eukprot:4690165-Pleurochrysis_carterae.AAC.1
MSRPKGTDTTGTRPEPSSIGSWFLLVSGLETLGVCTRRSGPFMSSSRSNERFRGFLTGRKDIVRALTKRYGHV